MNKKKYDKAEKMFLKSVKTGNEYAYYNLGLLYTEQKKYDKAEEMYLKSIKETGNLDAYNNLGTLYYQQKKIRQG